MFLRLPAPDNIDVEFYHHLWNHPEVMKMVGFPRGLMINKKKVTDPESNLDRDDFINGKYLIVQKGKKNYFLIILKN